MISDATDTGTGLTAAEPPLPYTPPSAFDIDPGAGLLYTAPPPMPIANVLTVGAGEEYATLSSALAVATDGATILVAAGTYVNDFGTITSKVKIVGVGGMANFVATEAPTNEKGILTVDDDAVIENCSFSGAAISAADGGNAAGIRYEGGQLTLIDDSFSNNQDGLLAAAVLPQLTTNTITIDHSSFTDNGSGSGFTHNLYVGAIQNLTVTNSTFEGAVIGHELKSRALVNNITDNVIADGPTGTASYDIDLPDGGTDTVSGNLIEKGASASNDVLVHFGGEGIPYAGSSLTVTGNTLIDDLGAAAIGVLNQTVITAEVTNNTFVGFAGATVAEGPVVETGNVDGNGKALPNTTSTGLGAGGATVVYTDDAAHSITLNGTINAVEGGGGLLTVVADIGHVIVIGGAGGLDFSEGPSSGGNEITTAANVGNVLDLTGQDTVASNGRDVIAAGPLDLTGVVNGSASISGGSGDDSWTVNGDATISSAGGSVTVAAGADAEVSLTGSLSYLDLQTAGGVEHFDIVNSGLELAASVTGGAASFVAYDGELSVTTAGDGPGSNISLGAGVVQVVSLGADTIHAGSGSDTVIVSGAAVVDAGTGQLSVFGRSDSGGATIQGGAGLVTLDGDTGNLTFLGGAQAGTLDLVLARNTVQGGAGHLVINGGSDEDEIGGAGGITVNAADGGGADMITTAAGATDLINLAAADVVDSHGNDSIAGGSGNQTLAVYGRSSITGSTGNSRVTLAGAADTYVGKGQDQVTVQNGAYAQLSVGQAMTVSDIAATVQLKAIGGATVALAGTGTIADSAAGDVIATQAGSYSTLILSGGSSSVTLAGRDALLAFGGSATVGVASSGSSIRAINEALTVHDTDGAANGQVTVRASGGSVNYDQVSGTLTFVGGASSNGNNSAGSPVTANINAGAGNAVVSAGGGNVTLLGGAGRINFQGGTGRELVEVGSGGGTVNLGEGNVTVAGGDGAAMLLDFTINKAGGQDVVTGFRPGTDHLVLPQSSHAATYTANSTGTLLTLADGTRVQFVGVTLHG